MKIIDTTQVVDPSTLQPFTSKSLKFLQDSTKELCEWIASTIIGQSYDNTKAYVLNGVLPYGTNQYSDGIILYGGELYYTAGKSTTTAFLLVPVMTIDTANDATADPVTFSDLTSKNVHNIRTLILSDAVSGSGDFDLSDVIYINAWEAQSTPTSIAYNVSNVAVPGGVTLGSPFYSMKRTREGISLYFSDANIATLATTARIVLSLPIPIPTTSGRISSAIGFSAARMYKSGTGGIPVYASIVLTSTGSGQELTIEKSDGTAFGAISGYTLEFKIDISFVM